MLHYSAPPPASLAALNTVDLLTPIDLAMAESLKMYRSSPRERFSAGDDP